MNNKQYDVMTLGEAMVVLSAQQDGPLHQVDSYTRFLAGAELNVAVGLARLGHKVRYLSKVGNDSFGRFILDALKKENISTEGTQTAYDRETGFQVKSLTEDGIDPDVENHRRYSAARTIEPSDDVLNAVACSRHVHLTGVFPALTEKTRALSIMVAEKAKASGSTVSFDTNLRPALWKSPEAMKETINHLAFMADWVMPGLEEGRQLTGKHHPQEIAEFYLDKGASLVVVKMGSDGCYFQSATGSSGIQAAIKVKHVIDTVGAGDAFASGLISGQLDNLPLQDCVFRAAVMGAWAVQSRGDNAGLPTRSELNQITERIQRENQ